MPKNRIPHICIDRIVPAKGGEPAAAPVLKKWPNSSILRCRFLDGDATQRKRVEAKAHEWENFANIKFKFVARGDAEIRISFQADTGSWSALGVDALETSYFPKHQPTMNYGWLKADSAEAEYARLVLHEFGHALGLIHEHQSPKARLQWNRAEVYRVFSGSPNFWSKEEIDHNVLRRYSRLLTNSTEFDPNSIMLYAFPASLFLGSTGTKSNNTLSINDQQFISEMYPK